MAIRAHAQMEPLPGYRLIERLGGGGFGEVWKAEAPGGLLKAIKFVHGTLHSATGDENAVQQELKSLGRVKSVRHPYILSLERYDIIDGQLMIVMELADKNLWDRFKECQDQGLPGIPRNELLRYMEEAAEALDLMNIQYGLQHLDIKPQNLFLIHNHVKVADFGLVKDLEGMNTQVTGGVTPLYAAPETFDGVISRFCDQYNLAIVYQELLTGQRPFSGANVRQLMMAHLTGTPDLNSLPEHDRPIIARGLAKKPEERFPSCTEMVEALRQAGVGVAELRKESQQPVRPAVSLPTAETPPPSPVPLPSPVPTPVPRPREEPSIPFPVGQGKMTALGEAAPAKRPVPIQREEITGDGVLMPALVVGIGGTGRGVLQHLRQALTETCGAPASLPHLQLLYVETDPEAVRVAFARRSSAILADEEILLTRLNKPSHYLRPLRGRPAIEPWLNTNMLCRLPRNQTTADGLRVLGRLAFFDNYRTIVAKLRQDLAVCLDMDVLKAVDRQTQLGIRTSRPRVYVVVNLGGGTGSGMFIDLAYVVRRELRLMGVTRPEVVGLFLLPSTERAARKSPAVVNAFAALTELNHFSSPQTTFMASFDEGEEAFHETEAPFDRCVVLPLPEPGLDPGPTEDVLASAADLICRELVSPLGRAADETRGMLPPPEGDLGMTCQSFGTYVFAVPRRALLDRLRRSVTQRFLQSWLTPSRSLAKTVRTRLTDRLAKLEFTPESLIGQLQGVCEKTLGHPPETLFESIVQEDFDSPEGNSEGALTARERTEEIVGPLEEEEDKAPASTPLTEALKEGVRTIRREWEQKLLEVVRGLIDDPAFRIAGAEEAGSQLMTLLEEAIEGQQPLLEDLHTEVEQTYRAIDTLAAELRKGSWWPGRITRVAEELRQALVRYPNARYQSLVLAAVVEVYEDLLQKLPKRLEEVTFCRQRLAKWIENIDEGIADLPPLRLPPGRYFFPGDSPDVSEAIQTVLDGISADDLHKLDGRLQEVIREQFRSLPAICLAAEGPFHSFQEIVQRLVGELVQARLGTASASAVYLRQQRDPDAIAADLDAGFASATPALPGQRYSGAELRVLIVPDDADGNRLAEIAQTADAEVALIMVEQMDEVFFYLERPAIPLLELPQLGLVVEEVYKQMTSSGQFTPHTRTDITDWLGPT